ncbi:sulfotransferase [Marimonas lutisalis]|uniref:sulfotransferase n=1 Tax=Marimonas lutisalis TaxID=2545756 RepID=UPI00137608FC|nr:sulfotransferase [Marimonas lutisalis]
MPMLASAAALAALTLILVQIALRLPLVQAVGAITGPSLRSIAVLRARGISDHWKERAMKHYARRTFGGVLWFSGQIVLLAVVALGIGAGVARIVPGFVEFSFGWQGLILSIVVATGWIMLRGVLDGPAEASASAYTPMEQMMHRLALGNGAVAEMAFGLNQVIARPDPEVAKDGAHVFVAGLARAGTTVLTRALHESGAFGSLSYRDMPFVLAPNLWSRLNGGGGVAAAERAHGDGIAVDLDSVESLEEPFWRVFDGNAYLKSDRLLPHRPGAALVQKYRCYVAAILKARRANRYLAKNNNNTMRLNALAEAFPNAHLLVPFRDPVAHAGSLHRQHARFVQMHRDDPFSRDYMGWLGHHEFGSDHRPFAPGAKPQGDPQTQEYWLEEWCAVYQWLLDTAPGQARFVCYEDLCNDPGAWDGLCAELDIEAVDAAFRPAPLASRSELNPLQMRAYEIYDRLRMRSR